jgi:hypothetical protein
MGLATIIPKGFIHYKFKNMAMNVEPATVVEQTHVYLVATREYDQKRIRFIKIKSSWQLEDGVAPNSLLHGTCFVFEK